MSLLNIFLVILAIYLLGRILDSIRKATKKEEKEQEMLIKKKK